MVSFGAAGPSACWLYVKPLLLGAFVEGHYAFLDMLLVRHLCEFVLCFRHVRPMELPGRPSLLQAISEPCDSAIGP